MSADQEAGLGRAATSAAESQRAELLVAYKTAIDEYRFAVNLGWERQKFFVGLSVSLIAGLSGFAKLSGPSTSDGLLRWAFFSSGLCSVLGAWVVHASHAYYRQARELVQRLERALGYDSNGFALQTTFGMREGHDRAPRRNRFRVMQVSIAVLVILAFVDLAFAIVGFR